MAVADKEKYKVIGVTSEEILKVFGPLLPEEYNRKKGKDTFLLGAVDEEGEACGVLWYSFTGYAYEIMFLGVHPDHRRKGVGTLLLQSFLESLYKMNMVYPVWVTYLKEETDGFEEFMKSRHNFFYFEPDQNYKIRKFDRNYSKIYKKILGTSSNAKLFFRQSPRSIKGFLTDQEKQGLYFLNSDDLKTSEFDENLCFCMEEEGHIYSVLMVKIVDNDTRELSYVYVEEGHPKQGSAMQNMISALGKAFEENYPNTSLMVQTVNEKSNKLIKDFFPENEPFSTDIRQVMWDFSV